MLHDILARYLRDVEVAIRGLVGAYVERYEEEIVSSNRVNLRIRVRFPSGHLFEINEALVAEGDQITHLGYRYHLQDSHNNLVFRYDNTPHFPELDSFPHHKHLQNKVSPVQEPSIIEVIEEVKLLTA